MDVAFTQNGRPVYWWEVTTEDLIATVERCTEGAEVGRKAKAELARRGIKS
jgi:hypothetical protein